MRVWIYTRESQNSLEEQKKQVRKFCEQKGWIIAGESGDRSNGFNYKRAGLNEAIMESSMGNADAVVIKDRSVLGQDPWMNSCMIEELSRSDIKIYSMEDGLLNKLLDQKEIRVTFQKPQRTAGVRDGFLMVMAYKPGERERRSPIVLPMEPEDIDSAKEWFHVDSLDDLEISRIFVHAQVPWKEFCYDCSIRELDQYMNWCQALPEPYVENNYLLLDAILDAEDPANYSEVEDILGHLDRYQFYREDEMEAIYDPDSDDIWFTSAGYAKTVLLGELPYPAGDIKNIHDFGDAGSKQVLYQYGLYCMREHHVACTAYGYVKSNGPFYTEERKAESMRLFQKLTGEVMAGGDETPSCLDGMGLVPYMNAIRERMASTLNKEYDGSGLLNSFWDSHIRQKLISVRPSVDEYDGRLYQTLEIKSHGSLNEREIGMIKEEWMDRKKTDWISFVYQMETEDGGHLRIIPHDDMSAIQTEAELTGIDSGIDEGVDNQIMSI
ncbi:recombinase family protein [Enterocloster citroniae]